VTITIGGNDVGFGSVLGTCFVSDCRAAVAASAVAMLTVLPGRLVTTYQAVEEAAPGARLVVVGYPRLFPARRSDVTGCGWLTNAERRALNRAADLLDAVIAVQAWSVGATYVDVSRTLQGHELCTKDSWLVPLPAFGAAHPTEMGQDAIAAAVADRLSRLASPGDETSAQLVAAVGQRRLVVEAAAALGRHHIEVADVGHGAPAVGDQTVGVGAVAGG
jgi:hypothetical protein